MILVSPVEHADGMEVTLVGGRPVGFVLLFQLFIQTIKEMAKERIGTKGIQIHEARLRVNHNLDGSAVTDPLPGRGHNGLDTLERVKPGERQRITAMRLAWVRWVAVLLDKQPRGRRLERNETRGEKQGIRVFCCDALVQ